MDIDEETRAKNIAAAWASWRLSVGLGPATPAKPTSGAGSLASPSVTQRALNGNGRTRVLITGGSSGIGEALVRAFAALDGFDVFFTYKTGRERSEAIIRSLGEGCQVRALACDQTDFASVHTLAREMGLAGADILILNAALGSGTVKAMSDEEQHRQDQALLMCNAVGPLWLVREFLPGMRQRRRGTIVLLSSVGGGVTQFPGFQLADGMSKAALAFLAKQLAAELAAEPVTVFAVSPGATQTPMLEASLLSRLPGPEARAAFAAGLPKGALLRPEEVAELVSTLVTAPWARLLHGANVDASAGLGVLPSALDAAVRAAVGPRHDAHIA